MADGLNKEELELLDPLKARKDELREWEDVLSDPRENANTDHDYYDGKQWTQRQVDDLEARGQAAIVFNRVAPKINYILGTEIESRKKPRAYPRTIEDEGDADAITDALRYVADEDDFEAKFTAGATSVLIDGTGGIVTRVDTHSIEDATRIISDDVPYGRLFYDPRARKGDGSDARYKGVIAWKDVDELLSEHPDAAEVIEISKGMAEQVTIEGAEARYRWYRRESNEIQVIEHYYKAISPRTGLLEWHECWWVGGGYIEEPREVEFVDDTKARRTWCPLTICSPYVCGGSSEIPERYGPIRGMRGPQDEINHRRSKSIHYLNTRETYFETGALNDPEKTRGELMKANPFVEVSRGRLKDGFRVDKNTDLAAAHVQMLQEAKEEIDQIGPRPMPTQTSGGQKMSGRLYIAQQETGAMEMRPVFDALRKWAIAVFKRYHWLIRQTWDEEKWFVVQDEDTEDRYRLVGVNREMTRGERLQEALEEGTELRKAVRYAYGHRGRWMLRAALKMIQAQVQQMQAQGQITGQQVPPPQPGQIQEMTVNLLLNDHLSQEVVKANNIGEVNVNIIIETSPNSILAQHEQFQELVGMAKDGLLPVQDPKILRIIIEASSLQNKRKLLAMLDKPPDPAQQQAQQQAQQMQQMQMQKQIELLTAQVANLMAQSEKSKAQAALAASKVQTEPTTGMLKQAQAQKAVAEAQTEMQDGNLKQAQTLKTAHEAGQMSVPTGE